MSVRIRAEEAEDVPGARDVNRRAFGREDEARLVDDLREAGYARLSLVAEEGGRLVGHIVFSEAVIRAASGEVVGALALGPIGVIPDRQGRGVGSALIREGLGRCARAGHSIVVLLGHPNYYPRFGFSAERAGNLSSAYSGEDFMALELVPGALSGVAGEFEFAPPFEAVS
ncbi:MAG: Acetyltransferase, GNAT family [uncultured Rubrobacteraceae bacterium]|uniref:Acetyltransferase, GNAT family n=1 Tax=uncultured Rubrobacteraceae bacterium TaxID=349277 RepID=A0A6J4NJF2_9ACTN|nr:MAG: Acetyltransferase, GNAT family [uncultured Rubrobacteraceae bacterium]